MGRNLRAPRLTAALLRLPRGENIPRHSVLARITRVDVNHPVRDYRTRAVDRPAVPLDPIDGLELASRVEIPQPRALLSGISAQVPIDRAREHHPWECRDRRGLRGTASRFGWIARRRLRVPGLRAIGATQREDGTAHHQM